MKSNNSVFIKPIITRDKTGVEVPELGAGGGKGDLYQIHELELPDEITVQRLEEILSEHITDEGVLSQTRQRLKLAFTSKHRALSLDDFGLADETDIPFKDLAYMLSNTKKLKDKSPGNATIVCPTYSKYRFMYSC